MWSLGYLSKLDFSDSPQLGEVALKAIASLHLLQSLLLMGCPMVNNHNIQHLSR